MATRVKVYSKHSRCDITVIWPIPSKRIGVEFNIYGNHEDLIGGIYECGRLPSSDSCES